MVEVCHASIRPLRPKREGHPNRVVDRLKVARSAGGGWVYKRFPPLHDEIAMSLPALTLTSDDVRKYSARCGWAQMMFVGAGDDYAAARCLILNVLFDSGFPLMSMSVEKLLKAAIFLESGAEPIATGSDRHNPYALKQELERHADYGLDPFDAVLRVLFSHFQSRYHDNANRSRSMGGADLEGFDALWMHLFDRISFPVEVKYRLKFPAMLFDEQALKGMPTYRHWVTVHNKAMMPRLSKMEETYRAVTAHLYQR